MKATPEYRKQRLDQLRRAIAARIVIDNFGTLARQVHAYDQLVMIDRDMTRNEEQYKQETGEELQWDNQS